MAARANPTEAIEAMLGLPGHRSRLNPNPGPVVVVVSQKKLNDFYCSVNNASLAGNKASSLLVKELEVLLPLITGVQLTTNITNIKLVNVDFILFSCDSTSINAFDE
jgi:hypothetical protein